MEAQDSLNKYGRVKEAFVFETAEDSVRKKQLATPRHKKNGRQDGRSPLKLVLFPALVILPLLTGVFFWQTLSSSKVDSTPENVSLSAPSIVSSEQTPSSEEASVVLVDTRDSNKDVGLQERNAKSKDIILVSNQKLDTKLKPVAQKKQIPVVAAKVNEERVRKYAWIVYSAENDEEADAKTEEFKAQGAEVFRFEKTTSKGTRVRLAWAKTFNSYSKAVKAQADLPEVFSPESWLYQLN